MLKSQRRTRHKGSRANEQSTWRKIDLEIGHRQERMVERGNKKKIHQETEIQNFDLPLDRKGHLALALMQIFPQFDSVKLLLDSWQ